MDMDKVDALIERYIAMWHERDPRVRKQWVHALWAEDAENLTRRFTVRGLDAIVERVDRAHEEWVAKRGFVFRSTGRTDAHNGVVKFHWEMLPASGGAVDSQGLDIFVLDEAGRIRSLYQFSETPRS